MTEEQLAYHLRHCFNNGFTSFWRVDTDRKVVAEFAKRLGWKWGFGIIAGDCDLFFVFKDEETLRNKINPHSFKNIKIYDDYE